MKTTIDIFEDMYSIVKTTPINDLNGSIDDNRHTNSTANDCVINIVSGQTGKFLQNGAIYIKIFSLDKSFQFTLGETTYVKDRVLISEFEALLFDLSNIILNTKGYSFDIQSREVYTEAVQETNEHYSILKINFKSLL